MITFSTKLFHRFDFTFFKINKLSYEHYKNIDKLILHTPTPHLPTLEHHLFLNFTFIIFTLF